VQDFGDLVTSMRGVTIFVLVVKTAADWMNFSSQGLVNER
jgi:hypothetical protein